MRRIADRHSMTRVWQRRLGRTPPDAPTLAAFTPDLRRAHIAVLLEECLELAAEMGCKVNAVSSGEVITPSSLRVSVDTRRDALDLVEIAWEATDVSFILHTITVMFGLPVEALFEELYRSNLSKILPDGTLLRHQRSGDRHEQYVEPDIRRVLEDSRATEEDCC